MTSRREKQLAALYAQLAIVKAERRRNYKTQARRIGRAIDALEAKK